MANFTSEIKRDLIKTIPENRYPRLAMLAAFLDTSGFSRFSGDLSDRDISFTSENEEIAEYFLSLIEDQFCVSMTVAEAVRDPKYGRTKITFSYSGEGAEQIVDEITEYSAPNISDSEACIRAYLKGAFLGGGSCTLPHGGSKTGYHLEFVFRTEDDAQNFCELFDRLQLLGNMIIRGEKYVVYLKSREAIADFLSVIEADDALRRLEEVTLEREQSNNNNRKENCDAGNADKSAIASAAQVHAFQKLDAEGLLQTLPRPLQEAAYARMKNPTLSMQELAETLGVSKSCLNHRLRKLMQIKTKEENT